MSEVQEKGRGRAKNLELNLVPFIDLMSVLITFLLISAVWTQVSMIQIGTSIYGQQDPNHQKPPIPKDADIPLKVSILPWGYDVVWGKKNTKLPKINNEYDDKGLIALLEVCKKEKPDKNDGTIAMSDELPYELLVHGMDDMLKAGFGNLSILTGGPP